MCVVYGLNYLDSTSYPLHLGAHIEMEQKPRCPTPVSWASGQTST